MKKINFFLLVSLISNAYSNGLHELEKNSLLFQSNQLQKQLKPFVNQWSKPYIKPNYYKILQDYSVWYDAYPDSIITNKNQSLIEFLGSSKLWSTLSSVGITAIHTGPMKLAGSYYNGHYGPTVDGGFDPIGMNIAPYYGTNQQYQNMTAQAASFHGIIIGDLVPGHTGIGPDFQLALKNYKNYPDIYMLIEIKKEDWSILPEIKKTELFKNLTAEQVDKLIEKKYLPGHLERVLFSLPTLKKPTAWEATGKITGVDGVKRRFVYLHYFKPGQPSLNWFSFSFAAQRIIYGQLLHSLKVLGAKGLRIDANPFLGIEPAEGSKVAHSEATDVSMIVTRIISQMIRKMDGWSYQELNMPINTIKKYMENGPEFSYDFIMHPGIEHAVLTKDARLLNTSLQLMLDNNIHSSRLVHGLQNHDEINYELNEFTKNPEKLYIFGQKKLTGREIKHIIIDQLQKLALTKSYNASSGNGLCTTLAGLIASRLNINNPYAMKAHQIDKIKQGLLLMLVFNGMQPGILAISGWDLTGSLPLKPSDIKDKLQDGDNRWLTRGSYFLLPVNEPKHRMPIAKHLFPNLLIQLKDKNSFVFSVQSILTLRKKLQVAEGKIIKVLQIHPQITAFITQLPNKSYLLTAINFSDCTYEFDLNKHIKTTSPLYNLFSHEHLPSSSIKIKDFNFMLLNFT
ncbi:maltose alpha-D-glucosyltransferase [Legionella israelensis]|uniref:alpha-amylase family glycosyl hydrolase n=1 Tax=Legionella israelensis TaxID=454 RepID=UPI00117CF435|nr:alpha-amylase family glycosyl hydrolase [Legionella israelensis]QDP73317.1 maltose alpha-D-glucosyltransferase [Legionella israelensis]